MSYIVKNCPAFDKQYNECHSKIEPHKIYCQDCTDCLIKRVIKRCEDYVSVKQTCNDYFGFEIPNDYSIEIAKDILKLFEIERVDK